MPVEKATTENINSLEHIYENFSSVAISDFLFELPPLNFQDFKSNFENNFIKVYAYNVNNPEGFLLYSDNLTQGIEITLVYADNPEKFTVIQTELIKKFIEDAKKEYKGKIISYPMLGVQNNFTPDISNLGFNLAGEAILEFDFHSSLANIILDKLPAFEMPDGYSIDSWQEQYTQNAAEIVHNEFSKLNDAKFDPRFNSIEGTLDIINCITKGYYGDFLGESTTVLKYNETPIGFCFTNLTTPEISNIPLLCIKNEHKSKGLGIHILHHSVQTLKNMIIKNNLPIKVINTTCDTSNFAALKTYRKVGFKEKTYYSHAYMKI